MRIKKYLEFITEEFVSKDTKVNWGEAEFEVKEMFRIFNDLKDELPNEFIIGGEKFMIDKSIFGEKGKAGDWEPRDFEEQVEDISGRHTNPSISKKTTSDDLLKMETYKLNNGKVVDAKPYYDFIKLCRKLFWTGQKIQLDESGVKKLADGSKSIGRGNFQEFLKDDERKHILEVEKTGKIPNEYLRHSFEAFDRKIKNGEEMPLSSALEINGNWYIIGGNRRMTYYVVSGINPVIWLVKL